MLIEPFKQLITRIDEQIHQKKILLAVSGGVDSMVLLALFTGLPDECRPNIEVVHVNHHLRQESNEEEKFVKEYCHQLGVICHCKEWLECHHPLNNLEAAARDMRYAFFAKIAKEQNCDYVVTAHHGDDQAETILMRLVKGSQFRNLGGIQTVTHRANGLTVCRPLLIFSKEMIYEFAKAQNIPYREDQTNQITTYTRNRYRLQVIPNLKQENPNLLEHIQNFSRQIGYANEVIESVIEPLLADIVISKKVTCWQLDVTKLLRESEAVRYFILVEIMQQALVEKGVSINERQLSAVLSLLTAQKGQGVIQLSAGWVFKKRYASAFLMIASDTSDSNERVSEPYQLSVGENLFLSDKEWVTLVSAGETVIFPEKCQGWQRWELAVSSDSQKYPLMITRRQPGDKMIYNAQGQRKKIKRVLIDQKVPKEDREKIWVVRDAQQEISGIIPIKKSYLSIITETDKIHYRLIYLKGES
ncbi:tRNA lysidine(34) synthetase TilS [Vagococcus intermedius]|uniref:tRNA(Ile)-lysidine synthase n=1 Tax=Vagococcus intermedius TaxID=2991418 RepID=A0AAF0CUT6_9ENTE|nr:tRNA lysidine(34) synthetase TilS [Vagococcus intermedius]WEG73264.1 tRNA lysidine(34) synthetase TilS [Vagococcus intermedius]WEG75346.1 tRNA lysidine(34) synthetase TilS [Vagococcus intermedius]